MLAAWAVTRGETVLLIDFDPHGSLSAYFGLDPEDLDPSAYTLFQAAVSGATTLPAGVVRAAGTVGLSLVPAATALATLDRQLGTWDGMGLVLARALKGDLGHYDRVVVDCPPLLGVLMVNALAAAEYLVVPVQTEPLALRGLERMMRTLERLNQGRRLPLSCLIVPTLYDQRTRVSRDALEALRTQYPEQVWEGVIPVDTQLREVGRASLAKTARPSAGVVAYQQLLAALDAATSLPAVASTARRGEKVEIG
jgi:chromosome partitioning protein